MSRRTVLYLGMSLDGFIADSKGGVDWMQGDGSQPNALGSYESFLETIDTIIMGRRTYDQIRQELSPRHWPYEGFQTYVWTHRPLESPPSSVQALPTDWLAWLDNCRAEKGKDIWICGGAQLAQQLLKENQLDRLHLTILPCLLGQGLALFEEIPACRLQLIGTQTYNGMVDLVYTVLPSSHRSPSS